MSNYITQETMDVIIFPCQNISEFVLVKWVPVIHSFGLTPQSTLKFLRKHDIIFAFTSFVSTKISSKFVETNS